MFRADQIYDSSDDDIRVRFKFVPFHLEGRTDAWFTVFQLDQCLGCVQVEFQEVAASIVATLRS